LSRLPLKGWDQERVISYRYTKKDSLRETDSNQEREAIAKAYKNVSPEIEPLWENDKDLLSWLKSF
jgi:hypothetical protein